jgi:hypothetical protein
MVLLCSRAVRRRDYGSRAMNRQRQPDPTARLLAHALVGLGVGFIVGQMSGPVPAVLSALVAIAAHEELDAPLADMLTEIGL